MKIIIALESQKEMERALMASKEFQDELEELIEIQKINTEVILRDDISVRDIVELKVHDKHEATIPMVSHNGDLIWVREILHTNGSTKETIKITKEPRLVKLEPGTVTTGLVLRKLYAIKTQESPELSYSAKAGDSYPIYDLLCPEGIIRIDIHGETYVKAFNEIVFIDWLYVRKLRSLV